MFSSKKATAWENVIWGLVTLAVGIIVVFYLFRGMGTDPVQCPGTCVERDKCVWPYVVFSSRCFDEDGKRGPLDTVCCVKYDDIDGPPDDLTPPEDSDVEIDFPEDEESTVCTIAEFPIQFNDLNNNYRVKCMEGTNNATVCDIKENEVIGIKNACVYFPEGTNAYDNCCSTSDDESEEVIEPSISLSQGNERYKPINTILNVGQERDFYVTTKGSEVTDCRVFTINQNTGNLITSSGLGFDETTQGNCDDVQIIFNPDSQDLITNPGVLLIVSITNEESEELQRLEKVFSIR